MSSVVTLSDLRTQARVRADMVNSAFISDSELDGYLNEALLELYDLLVQKFDGDYYHTTSNISIGSSTNTYALPSDFYKLKGAEIAQDASSRYVTLVPYMLNERNRYAYSNTSLPTRTVRIRYIPTFTRLENLKTFQDSNVNVSTDRITIAAHGFTANDAVTLTTTGVLPTGLSLNTTYYVLVVDSDTIQLSVTSSGSAVNITAASGGGIHTIDDGRNDFDGINGYEALAIWKAVSMLLGKEETDASLAMAQIQNHTQRIESAANNRDTGMPQRIVDVNTINDIQLRIYQETNIRYRVLGNNIEFVYIGYLGI